MENKNTFKISGLSFSYEKGKEILHDINLEFESGKITAVVGANGCGKSTLLNLLAGTLKPQKGVITLGGENINGFKKSDFAKKVSTVHQQNISPDDITAKKLVELGRTPYQKLFKKKDADADRRAVEEAMKYADISDYADCPVSSLSGGQMQRVWLAMALAQQTDILLLDEITTYLDIHYQLKILNLIKKLNVEKNTTVITVLHDINLAVQYCDNIVLMKNGNVLYHLHSGNSLSELMLDETFNVKTGIIDGNGKQYYVFSEKG